MMEYILTAFYLAFFIFLIYKLPFFKIENISRKVLSIALVVKVIFGIALVLVYTYYYKDREHSDVYKYFDDGNILFSAIHKNPIDYLRMLTGIDGNSQHLRPYYSSMEFWFKEFNYDLYNDNRTIIRANALFRLFSFGYINVHTVFMAFLSFVGLTAILKVFISFFKKEKYLLLFSVFFVPSVLFWTSGVLKEGLVMFAFGLFFFSVYKLICKDFKYYYWLIVFLSTVLLMYSKFYVLMAVIPGLVSFFWVKYSKQKRVLLKFIIVHLSFFLLAVNSEHFSNYNFLEILSQKQFDFVNYVKSLNHVGSYVEIPVLYPTIQSLLYNIPQGFLLTFLRPHIFEINSFIVVISALENLALLFLFVFTFVFRNKKIIDLSLFLLCVSFVVILFSLSGMITPVLGALVRYKTPALPFLLIIFLFLFDKQKFLNFIEKYFFKKKIFKN